MKTSVVITLILMGTVIIVTPVLSDLLYQRNLVTLLSRPGITNVDLEGQMGVFYRAGCWATGCVMIGIAVLCAARKSRELPASFRDGRRELE